MIKNLTIPRKASWVKNHEYRNHYMFLKKYAELTGIQVSISNQTKSVYCGRKTFFSAEIDHQQLLIDYSDHEPLSAYKDELPCFKFHYHPATHGLIKGVFPIGPMLDIASVQGYRLFFRLVSENIYTCNSDLVINCQRPYANALARRTFVQKLLKQHYGNGADTSFKKGEQVNFWNKHRNCLVAVCVPGARNHMLDRGQYEQLALGVCTISPRIRTTLPYSQSLVPGIHYLQCAADYSDLIQIIEWCKKNREECRRIGERGKAMFLQYCKPESFWRWIKLCMSQPKPKSE